jgi:hypothetical protein
LEFNFLSLIYGINSFSKSAADAVLNDDQKRIRFRKLHQRQRQQQQQQQHQQQQWHHSFEASNNADEDDVDDPDVMVIDDDDVDDQVQVASAGSHLTPPPPPLKIRIVASSAQTWNAFPQPRAPSPQAKREPNRVPVNPEKSPGMQDPKLLEPESEPGKTEPTDVPQHFRTLVASLARSFQTASAQARVSSSGHLFQKLEAVRSGDATVGVSRRELLRMLARLSEEFRHFALTQR